MGKVNEDAKEFVMLEKVHEGKTRSIVVNLNLADVKWRPIGAVDWSQQLYSAYYVCGLFIMVIWYNLALD